MWKTRSSSQQFKNLPGSFSFSIKWVLPKKYKKSTGIGDVEIFYTEAIYGRIMCFTGLKQIDLKISLNYELAPIPTAFFQGDREMWDPKAKSVLKETLEVTVSGHI